MLTFSTKFNIFTSQWRHNGRDNVSDYQPHDCFLNRLFRRRSKKTSKLRVTGLCRGIHRGPVNSPHKWPVTRKMFPFDDVIMKSVRFIIINDTKSSRSATTVSWVLELFLPRKNEIDSSRTLKGDFGVCLYQQKKLSRNDYLQCYIKQTGVICTVLSTYPGQHLINI